MDRAKRRVVVTGLGLVTPVGADVESTWEAVRQGRGGVGPISLFDARTFPTRIAAEVKDFRLARYLGGDAARWENHGRNTVLALAAAAQAVEQSGLLEYAGQRQRHGLEFTSGPAKDSRIFRGSSI